MNKIQPTIQRLFILSVLAFLAYFPLVIDAQNQPEKILLTEGAGTISGSNKVGKVIVIDVTTYESGKILYNIDPAPGTGMSRLNGKCSGLVEFDENGKKSAESRNLLPAQIMGGTLLFSKPTNFTIKVSPRCDPTLSNNFTYQIFLTDAKLATNSTNCSPTTNEINPAQPSSNLNKNFSDALRNGQTKDFGGNTNGDNSLLFVNGIDMQFDGVGSASSMASEISRITNLPVKMIYNNSSVSGAMASNYTNVTPQSIRTNLLNNPPSAQMLASLIYERLNSNKPVNIVGYSQGAAIIKEAIERVIKCLQANQKSLDLICKIRVLSIAGAARRDEFPSCIGVSGFAHSGDKVAQTFGQNGSNSSSVVLETLRRIFISENDFQHTNYFRGQNNGKSDGDVIAEDLIRRWSQGSSFGFEFLDDMAQSNSFRVSVTDNLSNPNNSNLPNLNGIFTSTPSTNNRTADAAFSKAVTAQNQQNYNSALDNYNTAINQNPNYFEAYNNRGVVKEKGYSDYAGAVQDYSRAIELQPNNATPYINRSTVKIKMQDYQGAIADSAQAIKLAPQNPKPYVSSASAKVQLKDYQGAIADSNKAINLAPKEAEPFVKRAEAKVGLQNYGGAIQDYTKAITNSSQNSEAYNGRGIAKEKLGQSPCEDFQTAAKMGNTLATNNYQRFCGNGQINQPKQNPSLPNNTSNTHSNTQIPKSNSNSFPKSRPQTQNTNSYPQTQNNLPQSSQGSVSSNNQRFVANDVSGIWMGKYICGQGATGLMLKIVQNGIEVQAEFILFPLPENPTVPNGSAIYKGYFDSGSGMMNLAGSSWIRQPDPTWIMPGFMGNFDTQRLSFSGKMQFATCGAIELKRQISQVQINNNSTLGSSIYQPTTPSSQPTQKITVNEIELSFKSNLFDEVIQKGNKFLETNPDNSVVHSYLAVAFLVKKDVDLAVIHLEKVVTLDSLIDFPIKVGRPALLIGHLLDDGKMIIYKDKVTVIFGKKNFDANLYALETRLENYQNQCPYIYIKGAFVETQSNSAKTKSGIKEFWLFPTSATLQNVTLPNGVRPFYISCIDDGTTSISFIKLLNKLKLKN